MFSPSYQNQLSRPVNHGTENSKKNHTAECQNLEVVIIRKKNEPTGLAEVNFQQKKRHKTFYVPVYAMYKAITST